MVKREKLTDLATQVVGQLDKFRHIPDLVINAGVAYAGYTAMKHPMGVIVGMLGYKLATSEGLISSAAGVAILAGIGLSSVTPTGEHVITAPSKIGIPSNFDNVFVRALQRATPNL